MSEKVIDFFSKLISSKELVIFIVSMLPVVELRGAIPLGVFSFNFSLIKAFLLSVAGNILIVFPLVFFLDYLERQFKKVDILDRWLQKLFARASNKAQKIQKYKSLGLFLFVAIPLPGTGAWTGALIAYLLGMGKWVSLISISLGVIMAGVLVSLFTSLGLIKGIVLGVIILLVLDKVLSYILDNIWKGD
jgi:uncharacterized membrane protein